MAILPDHIASAPHSWPNDQYLCSPESIISSTSYSSRSPGLSIDVPSSQSSLSPFSIRSVGPRWTDENEDQIYNGSYSRRGSTDSSDGDYRETLNAYNDLVSAGLSDPEELVRKDCATVRDPSWAQISVDTACPEARKHPRRTQRFDSHESEDGKVTTVCPRPPPPLVRQSERKDNFVDSLVGKLTLC